MHAFGGFGFLAARSIKNTPQTGCFLLAGVVSCGSNPLFDDFNLLAANLEKLGFIYSRGQVIIIPPMEDQ